MSFARLRARPQAATASGAPIQPAATPTATASGPMPDAERSRTDLITPDQAAAILSLNAKVLERWRGTGQGPAYIRLTSKSIRYRREDIDAFVAERVRASTAAA